MQVATAAKSGDVVVPCPLSEQSNKSAVACCADVRFGSVADICMQNGMSALTPESGHPAAQTECQVRPKRTLGLFDEDKFSN